MTDNPTRKHQYTPSSPLAEALSGPEAITVTGRSRCILSLQLHPQLPAGALVLIQPTFRSLLGDNPILQEVRADGSLSVLFDSLETAGFDLAPGTIVGSVQEVTAIPSTIDPETSPPPEATTHAEFDALPHSEKIRWLVTKFLLDASLLLQRDSRLREEVIWVLLQFADVISIGGYGETNLISHAITVNPGTTPIKMKHRPLYPVMWAARGAPGKRLNRSRGVVGSLL